MRRLLLLTVLLVAGCGGDDGGGDESSGGRSVELVATDFALEPDSVDLEAGGSFTLRLANEGQAPHAVAIEGADVSSDQIGAGESTEVTAELEPGSYTMFCPVGDHREQGMEGTLVVGGAAGGGAGTEEPEEGGYG